jgi:hypothetical protein
MIWLKDEQEIAEWFIKWLKEVHKDLLKGALHRKVSNSNCRILLKDERNHRRRMSTSSCYRMSVTTSEG